MAKKKKKDDILDDDILDDELEDELDDELDDELEDDEEGKEEKPDFIPGKYKTEDDAKKGIKEQSRYIKKLEKQIKDTNKVEPKAKDKPDDKEEDGVSDEDFLTSPVQSVTKIVEDAMKKFVVPINQNTANNNYNLLKDKAQRIYPDFDIELNEDVLSKHIMKYDENYRRQHGFEVLCEAIEASGGKKGSGDNAVSAEAGSAPSVKGVKGGGISKKIQDSILNAQDYKNPIEDAFNK